jgi:hypothetical protein
MPSPQTAWHLGRAISIGGRIMLRRILKKRRWRIWTGFNWLRPRTSVGLYWTRQWTLMFRKRWRTCWSAEVLLVLLALHDGCCFVSCRLWAEVFHVSASGAGTVKWQQVSEDLVPVNITCIQDSPECMFHITAYNSQVDKILDVRLVQPGNVSRLNSGNGRRHSFKNYLIQGSPNFWTCETHVTSLNISQAR